MRAILGLGMLAACGVSQPPRDEPRIAIASPLEARATSERGETASFTIALSHAPTATVAIPILSSTPSEGVVSPALVHVTPDDWETPRTITVTGIDDDIADGDRAYAIELGPARSFDPRFDGARGDELAFVNRDEDVAGITLSHVGPLVTQETGAHAKVTFALASRPTADVVIELASSDPREGTVEPTAIVFTPETWDAPRDAIVIGIDDAIEDGTRSFTIVTTARSDDAAYDARELRDPTVANLDDDTAGFVVSPMAGLVTRETGDTASFSIRLTTQPTAEVTIDLSTSNSAEGTIEPASVTFAPSSWAQAQMIVVRGVDDDVDDDDVPFLAITAAARSTDPLYDGRDASDVTVVNLDDEVTGIAIDPSSLVTSEGGSPVTFTVQLMARPLASVTIELTSSRTDEATVSPASVTFELASWNAPHSVTVTPIDDEVHDGPQLVLIVTSPATSADASYAGVDAVDVSVTNFDDDCQHPTAPCLR